MYKRYIFAAVLAMPFIASAQTPLDDTLDTIKRVLNFFLGIAVPLAVAFFFWGLIKFIQNAENAELKKQGKQIMVNSGVALFLMVGIWSILGYVSKTVGLDNQTLEVAGTPDNISNVIPDVIDR